MEQKQAAGTSERPGSKSRGWAVLAVLALFAALAYWQLSTILTNRELVMTNPDEVTRVPRLVSYATDMGRSLYSANCASCHGADMKGSQTKGVPNLSDNIWLYDFGRISDIERTVLYGIRSGHPKSRNVTDMPPLGLQKAVTPDEIKDVIVFMRSLKSGEGDKAAIARGEAIFQDKGVCYDCHGREADGSSDYGAPNLADDEWVYGGNDAAVYSSIYDGRHGRCPSFIGKLGFAEIRALSVYIHANSEESPNTPKPEAKAAPPAPNRSGMMGTRTGTTAG